MTVPFGSFEEALKASANADVRKRLQAAVDAIPPTAAEPALAQCRSIVMEVRSLGRLVAAETQRLVRKQI